MTKRIQVSTPVLDECIRRLNSLAANWQGTAAPSDDTKDLQPEMEDGSLCASTGYTFENLKAQISAAKDTRESFISLTEATSEYLENLKTGFETADS
ncbi:MAG: hypothetical protein IKO25_01980 [Clostridia bacterium]|nr:hypothetical protein [Clostridia bacterium]